VSREKKNERNEAKKSFGGSFATQKKEQVKIVSSVPLPYFFIPVFQF
jgi:hypothetical protein